MSVCVYDFDKTVFKKDSTVLFYLFCIKKNVFLLRFVFIQLWAFFLYVFGFIGKTALKERFFVFLKGIKNIDAYVNEFAEKNAFRVSEWYLKQKRDDDIIISASPLFLVGALCERIGIKNVTASEVDKKTGRFSSPNCHGEEKVNRFSKEYGETEISEFYSDSLSDAPLAALAGKAFIVKKGAPIAWDSYKPSKIAKLKSIFFSAEFIAFLIIGCVNAFNGIVFALLFSLIIPNANLAFIAGYVSSLTVSYFLNSLLVFRKKLNFTRYIKFCVSYIPNFLVQNGLVLIFYNLLKLNKIAVYVIAVIIAVPITFIILKIFAFGKKDKKTMK